MVVCSTVSVFSKITGFFSTIRARLILLILIALVPAVSLAVFHALEQRRLLVENTQLQLTSLVKAKSEDLLQKIRATQSVLKAMGEVPDLREAKQPSCAHLFKSMLESGPAYPLFLIMDGDGQGLCGSDPRHSQINYKDRDYFQAARRTLAPVVGRPVVGRVAKKPVMPIVHPILDSKREMTALLVSALNSLS